MFLIYTARLKKAIEASGEVEKPVMDSTPSGQQRPRMAAKTGRLQNARAGSAVFASFAAPNASLAPAMESAPEASVAESAV